MPSYQIMERGHNQFFENGSRINNKLMLWNVYLNMSISIFDSRHPPLIGSYKCNIDACFLNYRAKLVLVCVFAITMVILCRQEQSRLLVERNFRNTLFVILFLTLLFYWMNNGT